MGKCVSLCVKPDVEDEGPVSHSRGAGGDPDNAVKTNDRTRKSSGLSKYSTRSRHVIASPARIGAFNVQRFGKAKIKDEQVVETLVEIVRRYDVLLIQEVVDVSGEAVQTLLNRTNEGLEDEDKYDIEISQRLGRGNAKEQYAFLYKPRQFKVNRSKVYEDPDDVFMREPFAVSFGTSCIRGAREIVLIGIHTQPKSASKEIDALSDVSLWARKAFKTRNVVLMGDFNGGGSYMTKSDWESNRLRNDKKHIWLIPDHIDTTTTDTLAAYDRIVIHESVSAKVRPGTANVWRYDQVLPNCSNDLLKRVSDHYPVEVEFLPETHPEVEENISIRKAVVIEDKRRDFDFSSCLTDFSSADFEMADYGRYSEVSGVFDSLAFAGQATKALRKSFPDILSYSLLSAVKSELRNLSSSDPGGDGCGGNVTIKLCLYTVERRIIASIEY